MIVGREVADAPLRRHALGARAAVAAVHRPEHNPVAVEVLRRLLGLGIKIAKLANENYFSNNRNCH